MFVFVPQQRAALLEDFVAQVTGVDAVLQPLLLGQHRRVRVCLLLGRGAAVGAAVRVLLLQRERRRSDAFTQLETVDML